MRPVSDALLAAVSAGGLILAFPGFGLPWLAWIALAPLLDVVRRSGPRRAFAVSFVAGYLFFSGHLAWALDIRGLNAPNFALGNAVNAAWVGLFGAAASLAYRRIPRWTLAAVPAAWVLVEYAKLHASFLSFPWGVLGSTQYEVLPVIQIASLTGVYGISFLIVMVNAALVEASRRWLTSFRAASGPAVPAWQLGACVVVLAASLLYPVGGPDDAAETRTAKVALVQGNVSWNGSRDRGERLQVVEAYRRLTLEAARRAPDLIAWPSDSVPALLPREVEFAKLISEIARDSGTHLLVGSSGQEKFEALPGPRHRDPANSAFLLSPAGELVGRYDKMWLLPFDEYLPLRAYVGWPEWIVHSLPTDFRPGNEPTVFTAGDTRFGVLICWENLFPDLFRETAARGVDFVVSMTNESFTPSRQAHAQMLAMNAIRAVENRMPIVRTSPTGISAVVDRTGRIRARIRDGRGADVGVSGHLVADVRRTTGASLYTRAGDWFVATLAAFLGVLAAAGPLRDYRLGREDAPEPGGGAVPESP